MANIDVVLDLGSSCLSAVTLRGGYVVKDPTIVAVDKTMGQYKAAGFNALKMYSNHLSVCDLIHPIREGVIKDAEGAKYLISNFLTKVTGSTFFSRLVVHCVVACGLTKNDKADIESVLNAVGVKQVKFIYAPEAAAKRLLSEFDADYGIVCDIGSDVTDICAVGEGILCGCSLFVGGNAISRDISDFIVEKYGVKITAEEANNLKCNCASLYPNDNSMIAVSGLSVAKGIEEEINVTARELYNKVALCVKRYASVIEGVLLSLSGEALVRCKGEGLLLCGGGSALTGIDKYLYDLLKMPVRISQDGADCVILGALALVRTQKNK